MCKCNPNIRTPWCGKPGCETPPQRNPFHHTHIARSEMADTLDHLLRLKEITILPRNIVEKINDLQIDLIAERERKEE